MAAVLGARPLAVLQQGACRSCRAICGGSAAGSAAVLLAHARARWLHPAPAAALQVGLSYICATAERFFAVGAVLSSMVTGLAEQPSVRLLKHIIRCYLRLRCAGGVVPCGGRWLLSGDLPRPNWLVAALRRHWARRLSHARVALLPLPLPPAATTRGRGRRCGSACPTCCATRRCAAGACCLQACTSCQCVAAATLLNSAIAPAGNPSSLFCLPCACRRRSSRAA